MKNNLLKSVILSVILLMGVSNAWAATSSTFYLAIEHAKMYNNNNCSGAQFNIKYGGQGGEWKGWTTMEKTDKTYNGKILYKTTYSFPHDGYYNWQFRMEESGNQHWYKEVYAGDWNKTLHNNQIYDYENEKWVNYTCDAEYTVYFVDKSNWGAVKAYAWNGNCDNNTSYPGADMTKADKTYEGYNIFSITFNKRFENILFNGGDDSKKTDDLVCYANAGKMYDNNTWIDYTYDVTVSFDNNGHGTAPAAKTVLKGKTLTAPTEPTAEGYIFGGWYKEPACINKWNFDTDIVNNDITLYAQWECALTEIQIEGTYAITQGGTISLRVADNPNITPQTTYLWKRGNEEVGNERTLTISCELKNAGNYTCTVTNDHCSATNNFTVKYYHLKGFVEGDNNQDPDAWNTPHEFVWDGEGNKATLSIELKGHTTYQFKLNDGTSWYWNEGTMTHNNCTDWVIEQQGYDTSDKQNTKITTTAPGIYTFTLNYDNAAKPQLSVIYPAKRIVYLEPYIWAKDNPKFAVHAWGGAPDENVLMTKIDDCADRNIYFAEIDAAHTHVIFIRGDKNNYSISDLWNNVWDRTVDLTLSNNNLFYVDNWNDATENDKSNGYWKNFTPNYSVTFDANGHGTAPADQCIAEGGKVTTPAAPTATGYTFGGWYKEAGCTNAWDFAADVVSTDITLYAQWTANTYTITLDQQEATTPGTTTVKATYGSALPSIAENLPTKTGYNFGGYFTEPNGNGTQYYHGTGNGARIWNIASETTLYAYWKPNTCTLIFNMNGGVGEQPNLTATYDQPMPALTAPLPTLSGYEFSGYFDEKTGGVMYYNAAGESARNWDKTNGEKTLYAQWAAIHTITWMVNGSQAEGDPTTSVVNGQTITTLPTTPDVDCNGKVFVGWTTATIHGETATIPDPFYTELGDFPAVTSNMTFNAVFADGEGDEHWVETEINDIEATDEVVVMMAHGANLYALPYDKENASNSNPVATPITLDDFAGTISGTLIWYIKKGNEGNITLSPKTATDKYLTCNKSSNAVRINTGENRNFTIENDFLKNTAFDANLAISTTANTPDWRHYESTNKTISNKAQTLKFYKKTIVYTSYTNYSTSCMAGVCDITNANPIYVTSAVGQKIKAVDKLVLTTTDMAVGTEISLSAPNITFYKEGVEITQLPTTAASETFELEIAYQPTTANITEQPTITLEILGYQFAFDNKITGRSLPETFAVVAKVGNMWYALPEVGYEAEKHATAYPVEVDDAADPTKVTSAVANNAAWSLRQVYQAQNSNAQHDRYATSGSNFVLENKQDLAKLLNASAQGDKGSNNYLLTYAQYDNYYSTNPGLYEWTPTTTDLETYTLTNVQRTDKQINISTNAAFGLHAANIVTNEVRFLPIENRYTPLALQVVEWKEKSVVVMYNGDPAQTASVSVNGGSVQTTELSGDGVQKDIAVYELTANGLADNPTQRLSITIGSEKVILPIPYIVSGDLDDATLLGGKELTIARRQEIAKISDLVILNGGSITAERISSNYYKFRNVTIYGGGSLIIPADKGFGANTLTMRVGGVENREYVYTYPQLDLNGTINSGNINLDLMTTYDYYYPFSVPYEVTLLDVHYPTEIYGSNVTSNNKGSFLVSYYDGAARAQGNTGWKDVEGEGKTTLSPRVGYSIWGLPKKVSVNGATSVRQTYGIHRIPMKKSADEVMNNETQDCTVSISSHGDEATRDNDKGWNFIGNPYLAQYGGVEDNTCIHMGLLEKEMKDGQWTGGWVFNGEQVRYVTQTNDCLNYTSTPVASATIPAFSAFFIQAAQDGAIAFTSPNVAAAQSLTARRSDENKEITTGIILSGEKHSDRTGLLIADKFTEAYEFNADLSKFDNQDMNLYTIAPSGKLAFMAINEELAKQTIPLGYSVSADGMYTIAFDEQRYNRNDIYALYLIDYDRNETTNLLQTDYNFYSELGAHVERFALQVAFAPKTPTDVEYTQVGNVLVSREGNTLRLDNLPSDATVTIYDAVGHLIEQHSPSQHLQVNLPTGYYLMHIANKQDAVVIDTFIP